ncbi:hypothetical protein KHA80_15440 [Anaerobacillus sp. HL2]|nr:hypothetical protein KHA80_15440 [Anaerobacillus sp. HL2]
MINGKKKSGIGHLIKSLQTLRKTRDENFVEAKDGMMTINRLKQSSLGGLLLKTKSAI